MIMTRNKKASSSFFRYSVELPDKMPDDDDSCEGSQTNLDDDRHCCCCENRMSNSGSVGRPNGHVVSADDDYEAGGGCGGSGRGTLDSRVSRCRRSGRRQSSASPSPRRTHHHHHHYYYYGKKRANGPPNGSLPHSKASTLNKQEKKKVEEDQEKEDKKRRKRKRKPLTQMASALRGVEFIAQHIKKADKDREVSVMMSVRLQTAE